MIGVHVGPQEFYNPKKMRNSSVIKKWYLKKKKEEKKGYLIYKFPKTNQQLLETLAYSLLIT